MTLSVAPLTVYHSVTTAESARTVLIARAIALASSLNATGTLDSYSRYGVPK